jgi:hypothetical protein
VQNFFTQLKAIVGRAVIINLDAHSTASPESLAERVATDIFDVIIEATRKHFTPEENTCARLCFLPLDERFQEYVALDAVDSACFNAFVRACEAGLAECRSTSTAAWGRWDEPRRVAQYAWEWAELIKKLHADPRYKPAP